MYDTGIVGCLRVLFFLVLAVPVQAIARTSDGSDGAFSVVSDRDLDVSTQTVFNFTTFSIEAGATLRLINGQPGQVIELLASGDIRNDGVLDAAGLDLAISSATGIINNGTLLAGVVVLESPQGKSSLGIEPGQASGGIALSGAGSVCLTTTSDSCAELVLPTGGVSASPGGLAVIRSLYLSVSGYSQEALDALPDSWSTPPAFAPKVMPLTGLTAHATNLIRLIGETVPEPVMQWQIATAASFDPGVLIFDRRIQGAVSDTLAIPAGLLTPDSVFWIRYRSQLPNGDWLSWSGAEVFRSAALNPNDLDGNGIDDAFQHDGFSDVNRNGRDDSVDGIRVLVDASGRNRLGIVTGGGEIRDIQAVPASIVPAGALPAGALRYGLFSFSIEGLPVDAANPAVATLTFYFPDALPADSRWYLYDEASGSVLDHTDQVSFNGNTVTVRLKDGGPGDSDGLVNGRIVDPGGPVVVEAVASSVPASSSSGGGGGCVMLAGREPDSGLLLWLLAGGLLSAWRRPGRAS